MGPRGASIVGADYTYTVDGQQYEGYLSYDSTLKPGASPAALVVHQWMGLGEMEKARTDEMAGHGYVAFAVDMYGKGKRATTSSGAMKLMHEVTGDPAKLQQLARKGIDILKSLPATNSSAIVANGYCFGGLVVLELARQAAPLAGVASFHGELGSSFLPQIYLPQRSCASAQGVVCLLRAGNLTTAQAGMAAIPVQVHHGDLDRQGAAGLNAFEDEVRAVASAASPPGIWETHSEY